jgi:hypothetical protein
MSAQDSERMIPGILAEISEGARQFVEGDRAFVQRTIHRTAVVDMDGTNVSIEQSKAISPDDMKLVQASGALALATTDWFNDVEWLQEPWRQEIGWRDLRLDAIYPLDYFDEKPTSGSFIESEKGRLWVDQYGSIDGFGSNGEINIFVPRFVAPDSRTITQLRYPDDPNALEKYNARYKQYMDDMNTADTTIAYYRAWDCVFSHERDKTSRVLGGLSFAGIGVNEVLRQGSPSVEDEENCARILLHYEPEQNGYVSRDIIITGDEAITEPYWDGEEDREPASEELLAVALELVREANATRA